MLLPPGGAAVESEGHYRLDLAYGASQALTQIWNPVYSNSETNQ